VDSADCNYRPFIVPGTWLTFITSLQLFSVKDPDDKKKICDNQKAIANLITEADDLFNENQYKKLYELLCPHKVMIFLTVDFMLQGSILIRVLTKCVL
jgi:hypothetical protein